MSVKDVGTIEGRKLGSPSVVHSPLDAASSASLYRPRKKRTQARKTQT